MKRITLKVTLFFCLIAASTKSWSQVSVYEHTDFKGKSYTYNEGTHTLPATIGNDVLSSVKVTPGWKVTLYEHNQDRGKSLVLTSDVVNLATQNFNDITSNIKVERLGKGNSLNVNQTLAANETLVSANGLYMLRMQGEDGNLCVYKIENGKQGSFVWGSMKIGFSNPKLILQADGNLVVYDGNNNAKWNSGTHPYHDKRFTDAKIKPVKLVLENDGSLKLYNASSQAVWTNK